MRWVLVVLFWALAAPTAAAVEDPSFAIGLSVHPAEVETALYFHPIQEREMPVNTQLPVYDPSWQGAFQFAPGVATLTCLDALVGGLPQGATGQEFHSYVGYGTPSLVDYEAPGQDGSPRVHPVRGLAYDVRMVGDQALLHWYLTEASPVDAGREAAPLVNVQVRVTVRASESVSLDDARYGSGPVLLAGATGPVTAFAGQVTGEGASQVSASEVGGRWVYGFAVPLERQVDVLERTRGYVVRIDVLVDNVACEEGTVMLPTVSVFADPEHQPRILLRHAEPMRFPYFHPQFVGQQLVLHMGVLSPWGNYDVRADEARLDLYGPLDVAARLDTTVQRSREHFLLLDPVQQTWSIEADDLPDGRYTAVYTVSNLQGTASAEGRLAFHVEDGRLVPDAPEEAPGVPALAFVVLLAFIVALRRR